LCGGGTRCRPGRARTRGCGRVLVCRLMTEWWQKLFQMQEFQVPEEVLRVLRARRAMLIKGTHCHTHEPTRLARACALRSICQLHPPTLAAQYLARSYQCWTRTDARANAQCECRDCQNNKPAASEGEGAGAASASLAGAKKRKFIEEDTSLNSSSLANGIASHVAPQIAYAPAHASPACLPAAHVHPYCYVPPGLLCTGAVAMATCLLQCCDMRA